MTYSPEKSHVGLGYHLCPVCTCKHDEVVLLDTRLKNTLPRNNFMGWAMCKDDQQRRDEGYIALVGANTPPSGETMSLENADRTGDVAHIRSSAWSKIFATTPVPDKGIAFVDPGVIDMLKTLEKQS